MAQQDAKEKSPDEELTRFHEGRKGDVSLWESKPVRIRVRRGGPSTVFSLRLTPEELTELFQVAEGQGVTTSEFIRRAALDAAHQGKPHRDREVESDLQSAKEAVERALAALRE